MSNTTTNIDQKRMVVSADKLRQAMHERDLTAAEVAELIGKSPASVSRGMKSQSWLSDNLPALVKAVKCSKGDLLEEEGTAKSMTRGPGILHRICGEPRDQGYVLPSGCEARNVTHTTVQAWFLCAPRNRSPLHNELIVVSEHGEPDRLYRYATDRKDPALVVLMPVDPDDGGLRVVKRSDLTDIRVAIAPLMLTGGVK